MKIKKFIGFGLVAFSIISCATNPITGRTSLKLVGDDQIDAMALTEYKQALAAGKVISGTSSAAMVQNVGTRLKNAASAYYRSIGREGDLANYHWEFHLLDDKQVNAWCMPGGKVVVYSGILPITQNETGLAVVLGHEISHALAGHGNERISQSMIAQYGGQILGSAISNQQAASIFSQVYPIGSQVALLKYGRNQELEADHMGLDIMAMAGYNPQQAIPFWSRMQSMTASSGGQKAPEFLSTHPDPGNRIADLQKEMPEALAYYKAAGGK